MLDIIKLAFSLAIISAVAGLAIGMANDRTKDRIALEQHNLRQSAIEAVFPEDVQISEVAGKGTDVLPDLYWVGFDGDTIVGYAFELSSRGYAGDIKFMVGVAKSGEIFGITVLDHNETPGLGSRMNEVPSSRYIWMPFAESVAAKPWFTEQFIFLSVHDPIGIDKSAEWHNLDESARENLKSKNAVTAITGSTITTVAFTRAIEQFLSAYLDELQRGNENDSTRT